VLGESLDVAIPAARAEIAFFLAGADPWEGDRLGRLALTKAGLEARDALIRDTLVAAGVPICVTLAGADPHEGDRLGRLALTFDGLARRDHMVLEACREVGLPVCLTIAGGYGRDVDDTVRVHVNTVRVASAFA
jgi:acetoin utilization deacetylase AcuC-like enzyme